METLCTYFVIYIYIYISLGLIYLHVFMLSDTKKRDLRKAYFFSNTFYFIEDLCVINDHLECDRNFKKIYMSESQLKKEKI